MREPETRNEKVIGLRLPDGTEIYPPDTWHQRSLETPEDRRVIHQSIVIAARNLSISENELLGRFAWVTRSRMTAVVWGDSAEAVSLADAGQVDEVIEPVSLNGEAALQSAPAEA